MQKNNTMTNHIIWQKYLWTLANLSCQGSTQVISTFFRWQVLHWTSQHHLNRHSQVVKTSTISLRGWNKRSTCWKTIKNWYLYCVILPGAHSFCRVWHTFWCQLWGWDCLGQQSTFYPAPPGGLHPCWPLWTTTTHGSSQESPWGKRCGAFSPCSCSPLAHLPVGHCVAIWRQVVLLPAA